MVAFDGKWLHAQLNLALRVVVHYARKLWPFSPRFGLVRFQQNYVVESLPPATAAHRALAHEPGRCTGCGACDDVCPLLARDESARAFMGPHAFVVAGARSATHLDDVASTLAILAGDGCASCGACERACPESIPILAIARSLAAQRVVVEEARAGRVPLLPADVARRTTTTTTSTTTSTTTTTTATDTARRTLPEVR